MKKLVCGIVGVMAVLSAASADDVAQDTAKLKAACQASDKLLWVESNQVCIPKNPCKDSKYESYCNKMFKDVQTQGVGYRVLVDAFARTHNLNCSAIEQNAKLLGQDYVICMGNDVMVFEFDDIDNFRIADGFVGPDFKKNVPYLCRAIGGQGNSSGDCYDVTESNCRILNDVLQTVYGNAEWMQSVEINISTAEPRTSYCKIHPANYEADKNNTMYEYEE